MVFEAMRRFTRNHESPARRVKTGIHHSQVEFILEQNVDSEKLCEEEVIIAVMGPTGSGKSSLISKLTRNEKGVGHELQSCTQGIQAVKLQYPERSDLDIVFVDTPGFDDTHRTDTEILEMIANWLTTTYKRDVELSGILYLHRISDNRMAGTPLKNLNMFERLCGKHALKNVILITTMWDEVEKEIGDRREAELKSKYWKAMIRGGSSVERFENSPQSAWRIVDQFLERENQRQATTIQKEMVDMKKTLPETRAAQELMSTMETLVNKQMETLREIRQETRQCQLEEGGPDNNTLQELKREHERIRSQLDNIVMEMEKLRLPLRMRLFRILRAPLGFRLQTR